MATLGQQLKQAREERGLTINQIAEATRLGSRFLEAIENDDYKILPGGVFNRAFVRKFARQVGMDEDQAVRLYDQQLAERGGEPAKTSYVGLADELESRSSGNSFLFTLIVVIILAAAGGAAWLAFKPASEHTVSEPIPTPPPLATPSPTAAAEPSVTPTPEASPTPETINGLRVQLTANTEDCWISFRTDGGKNDQVTIAKGSSHEFLATEKISFIRIGNLPALNITVNGKRVSLEKLVPNRKGQVVDNVVISKDNYQGFLE
ncbi:MAG: helix-turn-helix domain-containing protein [Acidobacteria bacterium]|nr:helix-turn-helix domain-containing protein [Acidobacteriota bacterium]